MKMTFPYILLKSFLKPRHKKANRIQMHNSAIHVVKECCRSTFQRVEQLAVFFYTIGRGGS